MTHPLLMLSQVDTVGWQYKIFYECDILYFELSNCVFSQICCKKLPLWILDLKITSDFVVNYWLQK